MKTSIKKICETCEKKFLILEAEQVFYQKKKLPHPENCPKCRHKNRLSLRNENNLHKINCANCNKSTLSTYSPNSPYIIYCRDCYYKSLI